MKMYAEIPATMLAPCGMTCAVCYVHLRNRRACQGCRGEAGSKPAHCRKCAIAVCAGERGVDLCAACPTFPCPRLKRLDKSYRLQYGVSLVENAVRAKAVGAEQFLREERVRWSCPSCGGIVSLHDRLCSECGSRK